jgi:hypothetical protein
MCEVKREFDGQNTLYNLGGEYAVGHKKSSSNTRPKQNLQKKSSMRLLSY